MEPTEDQDAGLELADYRELVQTAGWQRLKAHADKQWGAAAYGWQMRALQIEMPPGEARDAKMAGLLEAASAIDTLFAFPQSRMQQLTTPAKSRQPFAALRRIAR